MLDFQYTFEKSGDKTRFSLHTKKGEAARENIHVRCDNVALLFSAQNLLLPSHSIKRSEWHRVAC